ncbi:hypothetical protein BDBG_07896 [Blastomyces gilchristii SLH14081]|uniref:NmrA-like domain-containing protein n=1 Tax=Blastomyces gilchristii (strain SLH14081) TaxID=559298 RepID=A0A179UWU4_BLAGS|nr:uncharacterized protein BDBG_07896 [Blastomyces gilchristii SLH14081]OAT12566.1 hypothetical protein BDBG_07896 [Blastomyces gilchristii SLH14081]
MYFQTRSFHTQFDHDEGSNRWDQWARPIHCPLHLDANVPPIYFLSRYSNPGLAAKGWQVLEVDYSNSSSLRYALTGIDTYAVFACGIFYERFAPGGMAAFQLGKGTYIDGEGEYLMNICMMKAEIPYFNVLGAPVVVCMTSAQDLARYIVAALDLPQWTTEFRVCGRRMTLGDIVKEAEIIRASGDLLHQWRLTHLLATTAGCYDFGDLNLHPLVNVSPQKFRHWLHAAWTPALQ